ncbi:Rieske (2Fe-2S) protein [Egicoccus sp. AB-alg2]|uniref:Rieske (2Fe-2S) protein n=1 Tax=Egicoccus sp. AB-alg2 TaxID=3242693 RepID=UPI00359D0F2F
METQTRVSAAEVREEGRLRVTVSGQPVVVFDFQGGFVAYVDVCPHQGGPVCSDGSLHPFLTAELDEAGRAVDTWAPGGERVLACPWHGWEFWLEDGVLIADPTKRLRRVSVTMDGDDLVLAL